MFKQEKGVTLVALVITIIVLLILAGVSIAMISGQDGIFTKAQKSVVETAFADAKSNISTVAADALATYYDVNYAASAGGSTDEDKTAVGTLTAGGYVASQLVENENTYAKGMKLTKGTADTDGNIALTLTYTDGTESEATLNKNGSIGSWTK